MYDHCEPHHVCVCVCVVSSQRQFVMVWLKSNVNSLFLALVATYLLHGLLFDRSRRRCRCVVVVVVGGRGGSCYIGLSMSSAPRKQVGPHALHRSFESVVYLPHLNQVLRSRGIRSPSPRPKVTVPEKVSARVSDDFVVRLEYNLPIRSRNFRTYHHKFPRAF